MALEGACPLQLSAHCCLQRARAEALPMDTLCAWAPARLEKVKEHLSHEAQNTHLQDDTLTPLSYRQVSQG